MAIQGMNGIEWEGLSDPAVTAFLHSEITIDPREPQTFTRGFIAVRRTALVKLLKKFGVETSRDDMPIAEYAKLAQVSWGQGKFGNPEEWAMRAQDGGMGSLREENEALKARLDALEARLGGAVPVPVEPTVDLGIEPDEVWRDPFADPEILPVQSETVLPVTEVIQSVSGSISEPTIEEILPDDLGGLSWNELQKKATSLGIKATGRKRPELEGAVREKI